MTKFVLHSFHLMTLMKKKDNIFITSIGHNKILKFFKSEYFLTMRTLVGLELFFIKKLKKFFIKNSFERIWYVGELF